MNVSREALRRQWGLSAEATDAEITAAIQSRPPLVLRPRPATPAPSRPVSATKLEETLRNVSASIARGDRVITGRSTADSTVAAATAPAPADLETHEAWMARNFPVVADKLGYATTGQYGFLVNRTPYDNRSYASAPQATQDERQHRAFMASNFPATFASRPERKSRIHVESGS